MEQHQPSKDTLPALLGYIPSCTSVFSKISGKDLPSLQRCQVLLLGLSAAETAQLENGNPELINLQRRGNTGLAEAARGGKKHLE